MSNPTGETLARSSAYREYVRLVHELEELACRHSLESDSRQRALSAVAVLRGVKSPACEVHIHLDHSFLQPLTTRIDAIMTTQTEIAALLRDANSQQQKAMGELTGKISTLQTQVQTLTDELANAQTGGAVTQELVDAANAVKATAQQLDDLTPDAPVDQGQPSA